MRNIHKFEINEEKREIVIDWHKPTSVIEVLSDRPFRVGNGYACCIKYELMQLIEQIKNNWAELGVYDVTVIDKTL